MTVPGLDELREHIHKLSAKEEIRDVLYRYTRGVDRADVELIRQCYHPDADDIHWGTFTGNAREFARYIAQEVRNAVSVQHEITNPLIEVDGDRAFAESRYTSRVVVLVDDATHGDATDDGPWIEHVARGRYLDVFERRDGTWRIAHRRLVREGGEVRLILHQRARTGAAESWPALFPDDLVYRRDEVRRLAPQPRAGVPGHFDTLRNHEVVTAARKAGLLP
jgi:hypothetical protein